MVPWRSDGITAVHQPARGLGWERYLLPAKPRVQTAPREEAVLSGMFWHTCEKWVVCDLLSLPCAESLQR